MLPVLARATGAACVRLNDASLLSATSSAQLSYRHIGYRRRATVVVEPGHSRTRILRLLPFLVPRPAELAVAPLRPALILTRPHRGAMTRTETARNTG